MCCLTQLVIIVHNYSPGFDPADAGSIHLVVVAELRMTDCSFSFGTQMSLAVQRTAGPFMVCGFRLDDQWCSDLDFKVYGLISKYVDIG